MQCLKMRGHRGYNICPWLKIGKNEICGKSCREEYCKAHRFMIRNGSRIPRPCFNCGIGVRSQIQLCRGCGRERIRSQKIRTEKVLLEALPVPMPAQTNNFEKQWTSDKPDECMLNFEYCFGLRD